MVLFTEDELNTEEELEKVDDESEDDEYDPEDDEYDPTENEVETNVPYNVIGAKRCK